MNEQGLAHETLSLNPPSAAARSVSLLEALEQVFQWRQEEEADLRQASARMQLEERKLRKQLAEIDARLTAIRKESASLESRINLLDEEEASRARAAVIDGLNNDRGLVLDRGEMISQAHARQVEGIDEPLELEPVPATVVAGIEKGAQGPVALEVVVPVPYSVYTDWQHHGDDLSARFAWRLIGAVMDTLRSLSLQDSPINYAERSGCLSIQVWIGGQASEQDLKDALSAAFDRVHETATELHEAGLDLHAAWLTPDILVPTPDEMDTEERHVGG